MRPSLKLHAWQRSESANQAERQRLSILNGPLPKNDPVLFTLTKVRVLRTFCVSGRPVAVGEIIELPKCDALSLLALHKAELI